MPEIAGKQQEVVRDGSSRPAPAGNQVGGERMPKIIQTRPDARAIARQVAREMAKCRVQHAVVQGPPVNSNEESLGERP